MDPVQSLWFWGVQTLKVLRVGSGGPNGFLLCSPDASGWWTGRIRGKQGLFPNNYVSKI